MNESRAATLTASNGQLTQDSADQAPRELPSRRSRRHRHSRRQEGPLLIGVLGLTLLIFILLFFGVLKINSLTSGNELLRSKLQEIQNELTGTKSELAQTRLDLQAAVEGRFPQLHRLEFDKVVPLQDGYLKNIVFTLLRHTNTRHYEYKLVIENNTQMTALPEVKVLVFDDLGVQLGMDEIPKQEPLERGETRSFSSTIELLVPGDPAYFYVVGG